MQKFEKQHQENTIKNKELEQKV